MAVDFDETSLLCGLAVSIFLFEQL